jgi:hypothetical protein
MKAKGLTPPPPLKSNELLAVSYIGDAAAYADAAAELVNFRRSGPLYFLFCHALELALKAYILATGGNRKELKPIRHDLKKLYDRAIALGYRPSDPRIPEIVEWLEPYHSDFSFRYKEATGLRVLPNPEELGTIFKILHNQIEPVTRAAYLNTIQK